MEAQFKMSKKKPKKKPKQTVKIRYVTLDTSFTPFRSWNPPKEWETCTIFDQISFNHPFPCRCLANVLIVCYCHSIVLYRNKSSETQRTQQLRGGLGSQMITSHWIPRWERHLIGGVLESTCAPSIISGPNKHTYICITNFQMHVGGFESQNES